MTSVSDPLQPFVAAPAPNVLREWSPAEEEIPANSDVSVRHLVFRSLTVPTPSGPCLNEVYAVIAAPKAPGMYPALVVLHGGRGRADMDLVVRWAKRGYVAIAPDLPGIADPDTATNSSGYWRRRPYAADRWEVVDDWLRNPIFQAVVAALEALSLLKRQPNVNAARVGVTGISWGGYMVTMLAGLLGDGLAAAFSLYGSGHYENCVFYDQLSQQSPAMVSAWMKTLDAAARASNARAPYFLAAATNDSFFYPPAVRDTLRDMSGPTNSVMAPNADHVLPIPGGVVEGDVSPLQAVFFDWHLKGEGAALPTVELLSISNTEPRRTRFRILDAWGQPEVQVFFSRRNTIWKERLWLPVSANRGGDGTYDAELPASDVDAFVFIADARKVSVSSAMFGVP